MSNQDFDKEKERILHQIQHDSIIMFYLDSSGKMTIISSGELSKTQLKISENVLSVIEPSIILSIVLFIEITLIKLQEKILSWFRKT